MIKYNEEIFEGDTEAAVAVVWWLVSLLGGKIVVPIDEESWNNNVPNDASLVMYKEDGKLIMEAERLDAPK